jgi:hypothetical protein
MSEGEYLITCQMSNYPNSWHVLSALWVPGMILTALCTTPHLIFTTLESRANIITILQMRKLK